MVDDTIRSGKWRCTEWRNRKGEVQARELYDHSKSDIASENLVDHPDFTKVTKRMAAILKAGPDAAKPEGE